VPETPIPTLIRVGHKGADAIVAGNTLASFDAALDAGVDMIEFDVLPEQPDGGGELLVVHDHDELRRHGAPSLSEALQHFSSPAYATTRLQLDLKRRGREADLIDALHAAGVLERSFTSTAAWRSLEALRKLAPDLQIGWTVSAGISGLPLLGRVAGRSSRLALGRVAAERIRSGDIDALVPQWQLVSRRLVEAVRDAGGEIYTWTVDDAAQIRRLAALGVTGVITNDPRLFALS